MKTEHTNLVKLCVGITSPEDLEAHLVLRGLNDPTYTPIHITRMWPKREAELVNGGSLYWVMKGVIQARQAILRLDEIIGQDGVRRCGIVLDRPLILTTPAPRRAFQGWRYLAPQDAPPDRTETRENEEPLPAELAAALSDIGIL